MGVAAFVLGRRFAGHPSADTGSGSVLGAAGVMAVVIAATSAVVATDLPARIECLTSPVGDLAEVPVVGRSGAQHASCQASPRSARTFAAQARPLSGAAVDPVDDAPVPAQVEGQAEQTRVAKDLEAQLGDRAGGVWIDGKVLHAGVTTTEDAAVVRAGGATPVLVARTTAELEQVRDEVVRRGEAAQPGRLRWVWLDPRSNNVIVEVAADSSDEQVAATRAAVEGAGPVVVRRAGGEATTLQGPLTVKWPRPGPEPEPEPLTGPVEARAGQRIGRCTMAFAARSNPGGTPMFLTAGHCFDPMGTPDNFGLRDGHVLGMPWKVVKNSSDDSASGLMNAVYFTPSATVDTSGAPELPEVRITGQEEAPVGAEVCKTGVTTGVTCGEVLAHDVWGRNTPTQRGYIQGVTSFAACAQGGDSGSPVYTVDGQAQGILVAAERDWYTDPKNEKCFEDTPAGGKSISYFLPIADVLETHDARLQLSP